MEIIRGKQTSFADTTALAHALRAPSGVHIDLGTGDGRFVRHVAQTCPDWFVIGVDACRDNLRDASRRAPANALFVVASAQTLPPELRGLAARASVNFPWGSLLAGLLAPESAVLDSLWAVTRPGAVLEVRLNAGALAETGCQFEAGADRMQAALAASGFALNHPALMTAGELRRFPSTWAKRLAFGRDPRALYLRGVRQAGGERPAAAPSLSAVRGV